jgi:hypothetical protein
VTEVFTAEPKQDKRGIKNSLVYKNGKNKILSTHKTALHRPFYISSYLIKIIIYKAKRFIDAYIF